MERKLSPFEQARNLHTHVTSLLMYIDTEDLPAAPREVLMQLKRLSADLRLDIRDYGMADSKVEQDRFAREARERLTQLEQTIVQAGAHGQCSAADVAHLSAQAQQLMADL